MFRGARTGQPVEGAGTVYVNEFATDHFDSSGDVRIHCGRV